MDFMKQPSLKVICSLLLLLTALIWGIAFVAQSVGTEHVGPWTFVFFRYIISALVLIPVSVITWKRSAGQRNDLSENHVKDSSQSAWPYLIGGILCGIFLALASYTQQAGIQYTSAGKAGFITALYVILVPIIGLCLGKRPEHKIWFCAVLGLAGLYLISVKGGFQIGSGDLLVMLCALLFSGQILSVDHYSGRVENVVILADLQFFVVAVISFFGMIVFEQPVMEDILAAAVPILYAGILSGAVGYTLQIAAQKYTDPSVASLIMSLEAVFSALAGWVILGEQMSVRELIGCVLVMCAVVLAQVSLPRLKRMKRENDVQ